jgi:hypothetical protein
VEQQKTPPWGLDHDFGFDPHLAFDHGLSLCLIA